jgi:predicted RNA-binding Zn-ribbon protein involved in translation (DUF1610 family)
MLAFTGEDMLSLTSHKICPKCGSSDLELISRTRWMRLISDSELYLCKSCGQVFLFSELLFYVGFFVFSCGIALVFLTFIADIIYLGRPGVGPLEKLGLVLSVVVMILGFFLMHKSR